MVVAQSDVGRVFLQSIISRRVISDKLIRVLFRKSIEAVKAVDGDLRITLRETDFEPQIHEINRSLEPLDFKIATTVDEWTGAKIWVFINTKSDELSQLASDFSPVEIAYFRVVVEQIVLASSESYSISSMTALREVNSLKPTITKSHAQTLLDTFVVKGWLLKSRQGRYSLSSRTLLELQTFLKTNYEDDIHECTICLELLTKGIGCYTPQCGARLHDHCYRRFARDNRTSCPSCQVDWSDKDRLQIIGEGALRGGRDSKSNRNRSDKARDDADDSEVEETSQGSEPEPEAESTPEPHTNGKGKGRGPNKARPPPTSDEEEYPDVDEESVPKRGTARRRK